MGLSMGLFIEKNDNNALAMVAYNMYEPAYRAQAGHGQHTRAGATFDNFAGPGLSPLSPPCPLYLSIIVCLSLHMMT